MIKKLFSMGPRADAVRPAHAGHCHNCDAVVQEAYCGKCGQSGHLHIASAHEFLHHFVSHYVAAEGKVWRTFWTLLARPGQLTLEFIRGRRSRFVDPLRLLLTISLLMFFGMKMLDRTSSHMAQPPAAKPAAAQPARQYPPLQTMVIEAFKRSSADFSANFEKHERLPTAEKNRIFISNWFKYGPTIVLCLVPVLAMLLKLLHLGSGWRYGEHLVFAFHSQSFALLMLFAAGLASMWKVSAGALVLAAVPFYFLFAMRKVYGGGWLVLLLRWLALSYLSLEAVKICIWIGFYGALA